MFIARRSAIALSALLLASVSLWGCAAGEGDGDNVESLGVVADALEVAPASPAFINSLFVDLVGRPASAAEVRRLTGLSRVAAVDVVLDGTEYKSQRIGELFAEYLGRRPTESELNALLPLASSELVAEKILTSASYEVRAGGTFVQSLYRDLLGRAPSDVEVSVFVTKTRLDGVRSMQSSAEARSRAAARVYASFGLAAPPANPRDAGPPEREVIEAAALRISG